jgi:glycosyltransferase involved in cell wall biosynthesis
MHVGVSAWRLSGQRLGIGRYIEYILKNWTPLLLEGDRVTVFAHARPDLRSLALSPAFTVRVVRPKLTNALWENLLLPRAAHDVDVMFGPSYTLPLTFRGPSVVTIHSVDEAQAGAQPLRYRLTYSQKYKLSARKADRVIVNARSTGDRVRDLYGISEDKIDVIWLGADESFHPIDDPARLSAARRRWLGDDRPYVLFAGGLSKRRNVPLLIEAFSRLKRGNGIPHALLLFGANRDNIPVRELAQRHGVADSVVHTDGLVAEHRELAEVYNAASVYVLPSSSDGFSLTLAEALSCGTPVITVNRAALGEIAHGYALTIEEPELGSLTDALRQVLTDPALARSLRQRGLERARQLRWDVTARRTLDVLRAASGAASPAP